MIELFNAIQCNQFVRVRRIEFVLVLRFDSIPKRYCLFYIDLRVLWIYSSTLQ